MFSSEVCTFGAPPQERTFSCIVHSPHSCPRYPKTLLMADLVQRSECSGRHFKSAHFFALCISTTPIYQVSKNTFGGIFDAEVCAPVPPQTHPCQVSKTFFGGMFGAEVCAFGAPAKGAHFWQRAFETHHTRYPKKTLLLAYLVQRYARSGRHPKTAHFWHHAFQPYTYQASKITSGGMFGAEVCTFRVPPQERTFSCIVHFTHTCARYPKTLLLAPLVQRSVRLWRHFKSAHFPALCISNTPIQCIKKHSYWHICC